MTQPQQKEDMNMIFELPELPFAKNALEPHMSAETFNFHHGKHHNAYVVKANELIVDSGLSSDLSLEELVIESFKQGVGPLFNNIGQHYNHSFFWNSLSENGGGQPEGVLADKITADFGSIDAFKTDFVNAGIGQFGSGWVWLVLNADKKLELVKTANALTPLTDGKTPILVCDVWEHAYYLDFQNRRPDFLSSFLDNLVNWDFASQNLTDALA